MEQDGVAVAALGAGRAGGVGLAQAAGIVPPFIDRDIAAERNADAHRIVATLVGIVEIEEPPQLAGLHADQRIDAGIKHAVAAEHVDPDRIALELVGEAKLFVFDDELQEGPEPFGPRKSLARPGLPPARD